MIATTSTIKHWPHADQPHNKLLSRGSESLTDVELLALLIRSGNRQHNAIDLAKEVLSRYQNNIVELSRCTKEDLMRIKGIGPVKAAIIVAAFELDRRRQAAPAPERYYLSNSRGSADYIRPLLSGLRQEGFGALYLTQAGWVRTWEFHKKDASFATIEPKRILKVALATYSVSIVFFTYRPKGSVRPTDEDKILTQQLHTAAKPMDITLLDHIILGPAACFSFADEGILG